MYPPLRVCVCVCVCVCVGVRQLASERAIESHRTRWEPILSFSPILWNYSLDRFAALADWRRETERGTGAATRWYTYLYNKGPPGWRIRSSHKTHDWRLPLSVERRKRPEENIISRFRLKNTTKVQFGIKKPYIDVNMYFQSLKLENILCENKKSKVGF